MIKPIWGGIKSNFFKQGRCSESTAGSTSARYCYSIWLRHLSYIHRYGLSVHPKVVAEFGPGDTLGVGLAALISGATKYYALDVIRHASYEKNLIIFDELVKLFEGREDIPGTKEFPLAQPVLELYKFPYHILPEQRLSDCLKPKRLSNIRGALFSLKGPNLSRTSSDIFIDYRVPWFKLKSREEPFLDLVISQAVMEHVEDLRGAYLSMYRWLKPNGVMSHEVDFTSHGLAEEWNGHWAYSDFLWRIMKGKRLYLINRQPHSAHIKQLREAGFKVVCDVVRQDESGIHRARLAKSFKHLTDDLRISGAYMLSVKPGGSNH